MQYIVIFLYNLCLLNINHSSLLLYRLYKLKFNQTYLNVYFKKKKEIKNLVDDFEAKFSMLVCNVPKI